MTDTVFDAIIIGAGPAGYMTAIRLSQLGKKVAIVEKNDTAGGTCLNVGCIPSKALLDASHKYWDLQNHYQTIGINAETINFNIEQLMQHKNNIISDLTKGIEHLFKKNKISFIKGIASIQSPTSVTVQVSDTQSENYKTKNIIIAVGSKPQILENTSIDETNITTSTGALSFNKVPRHLVVVGGGYIGLELGSVWRRLGAKVTIVEYADSILSQIDDDVRQILYNSLEKMGIVIKLGYSVVGTTIHENKSTLIDENAGHICVQLLSRQASSDSPPEMITCDAVLMAMGRKPATDTLDLKSLGIKVDKRGAIEVNKQYQTSIPGIYAIGDCIDGPMLAHKAMDEGVALAEQLAGQAGSVNYNVIPAVIFTHPEIATVGLLEKELKEKSINYKVGKFPYSANGRAKTVSETTGFVKILTNASTDRVLGCAIVGADAGGLIGQVAAIMEFGGTAEDIARTCHAHPTLNEVVKEAAWAAFSKPLHS